jgi:hypothetical protein
LDSLISADKLQWGQATPFVVFLIERAEPFGDKPAGDAFTIFSDAYREFSNPDTANYEIIAMTDVEADAAGGIIREWVRKCPSTCA